MCAQLVSNLPELAPARSTYVAQPAAHPAAGRRLVFNRRVITALKPDPKRGPQRTYYYDSKTPGLAVAVTATGKKSFVLYRRIARKPERITIGLCCDLSIEEARKCDQELNGDIARGENPAQVRRMLRGEDTVGTLFERYFEHQASTKKTADRIQGIYRVYLACWRSRQLSAISHSDVVRLHAQIGRNRGQIVANRAIELLRAMFSHAKESWAWPGENPAAKVKAFPERKRKRFLQSDELPRFFQALAAELNETIRDYILLSLLTGARRGNVQSMRWVEINFERAEWNIPETKNGEPLTIPLTVPALGILERRKLKATGEFVFPGRGRTGHLREPKTCWKRICTRAGIEDLHIHDLRRTFGAYQACAGTSLPIIGESLGHSSMLPLLSSCRLKEFQ